MKLKAKEYLESQKKVTGDKLAVRMSYLQEKGLANTAIQRDTVIRKMRANVRRANFRLASIAAQEKLNAERAQAKAEKLAGKKKSPDKPPAKTAKGAPEKKKKKEQTTTPVEQVKEKKEPLPATEEQEKEKNEQPPASDEQEKEKKEKSPATNEQE